MHTHLKKKAVTPESTLLLATMVLQFAFHIMLILCSMHILASAQYPFIAQPGCNSTCGGINISYPFGMNDPKCYADEWFEIECRSTSHDQAPYLKSIDLEVTEIDLSRGTIDIMHPIYHRNCTLKDAQEVVDLTGSPFVYSQERNKFVAVGCNYIAFLMSNGTEVSGCVSICDDKEHVDMGLDPASCNGKDCCVTSLPSHLSEYSVEIAHFNRENHGSDQCNFALILSEEYYRGGYYILRNLRDEKYVDAVLEWEIVNLNVSADVHGYCMPSNVTQNSSSGWRCYCDYGYDGNPYIVGGCNMICMIPFPAVTQIFTND